MKSLHRNASAIALALALAAPVFAQDASPQEAPPQAAEAAQPVQGAQVQAQASAAPPAADGLAELAAIAAAEDAKAGTTGLPAAQAMPAQDAGAPQEGNPSTAILGAVVQLATGGDAANGDAGQKVAQALDTTAPGDSMAAQAANAVTEYAAACAAKIAAAKVCTRLGGFKGIACRAAVVAKYRQYKCPGE